jgi:hypothetical protein
VLDSADGIVGAAADAIASHDAYADAQRQGVAHTFDDGVMPASVRAAQALAAWLARTQPRAAVTPAPYREVLAHG